MTNDPTPAQHRCSLLAVLITLGLVRRAVSQTSIVTVDDADPQIQYQGDWMPNPGSDPQMLNFDGTLTFTNMPGASATYPFTGKHEYLVVLSGYRQMLLP